MLMELLGVLQSHEIVNEQLLLAVALSSDPGARAYAASAIGRWADRLRNPLELLEPLATDANARVRLHAIVASSYIPKHQALDISAKAATQPIDKFIDYALRQTVFALKPQWQIAEALGQMTLAANIDQINLLLRAGEAAMVSGAVRDVLRNSRKYDEKLSVGRALIEAGKPREFAIIFEVDDPVLRTDLLDDIVDAVRNRSLPADGVATAALLPLVRKNEPDAIRLAGLWRIDASREVIESMAEDTTAAGSSRVAAVEALGNWRDTRAKELLAKLAHDSSTFVRGAAIRAFANIDVNAAARLAAELNLPPSEWKPTFVAFLQRQDGGAALADAFKRTAPKAEVAQLGLQLMKDTGRREAALAAVLNPVDTPKISLEEIPLLVEQVRKAGNAERGARVFQRPELACVTCHAVKGIGGKIGPDLGAVGTAQPVSFIIGAILDPQREVKEGFMSVTVTTKDGDEHQGYVVGEEGNELRLRESLGNQVISIPKDQIQQRRQSGSLMPTGLADGLAREEFVDLVKYLSELGE